jgi:hypothetical protein
MTGNMLRMTMFRKALSLTIVASLVLQTMTPIFDLDLSKLSLVDKASAE